VSYGATWDAKCGHWTQEGYPALRLCISLWAQEHADGLEFTAIPIEVIERGVGNTNAFINARKRSREIILRRKICLVGSSRAGKTSFAKSMASELLQPQIEHVDDRTIGIDHFPLRFEESIASRDGTKIHETKIHEVTFWDFAGQDAYQVVQSLFFSPRTLYFVCVDLGAFAITYMQTTIFADHHFQETMLLDEFVEDSVVRWVRMIVARQPDAEIVFIATKEDVLAHDRVTDELVKQVFMDKLKHFNMSVREMKEPKEKGERLEDDSSKGLTGWWKRATAVHWKADHLKAENQGIPTRDVATTEPTVVFVSCTSLASIRDARSKIKDLIFEMLDTYSRVLKEIVQIREAAKAEDIFKRISQIFAPVDSLPAVLNVEPELCRTILQTLHDLGDVLWYEDLGVAFFANTVILEPLVLIDFIREVFNHKITGLILPHFDLKAKRYWMALDADDDGSKRVNMKAMKQLLQAFHLVYSADEYRVMECDSHLIVPALWQTKMPASWMFDDDILHINTTRSREGEAVRVHWVYHFESGIPSSLFNHVVATCASWYVSFDAGPDWIMYKEADVAACRIMVCCDPRSLHRTIEVEAVVSETASAEQVDMLWGAFQQLCDAFVRVLQEHPGLAVSSFAWDDAGCKVSLRRLLWFSEDPPVFTKWMPPAKTWRWFQRLMRGQDRTRTIEDDWQGL
jgi:GTPase SAR1 family protein